MLEHITITTTQLIAPNHAYPITIGRGGFAADKREGDLCTPLGIFPMRQLYYRPDKFTTPPRTVLPVQALKPTDGWCDDPAHPDYNTLVSLPFAASHEKLWREDHLYDVIVPLGYNDGPIVPGRGSAIFMHLMRDDGVGTEGCIALKREHLLALLAECGPQTQVEIRG